MHPIIHLKAELEEILDYQRKLRNDSRYVQSRLYSAEYKFGPHLIRAAQTRDVPYPWIPVERNLEEDAAELEARRRELVCEVRLFPVAHNILD